MRADEGESGGLMRMVDTDSAILQLTFLLVLNLQPVLHNYGMVGTGARFADFRFHCYLADELAWISGVRVETG